MKFFLTIIVLLFASEVSYAAEAMVAAMTGNGTYSHSQLPSSFQGRLASEPTNTDSERATLFVEDSSEPKGREYVGDVKWKREAAVRTIPPGVAAEVDIPSLKLKVYVAFRPNYDPALPATHTVDVKVTMPADLQGGKVQNVPGILMKETGHISGTALSAISVKVTDSFFLVGLSKSDLAANLQLLRTRDWIDVPLVFIDGKRAILAIEKGTIGGPMLTEALANWEAPQSQVK